MEWISFEDDAPQAGEIFLACDSISRVFILAVRDMDDDEGNPCFLVGGIQMIPEDFLLTHFIRIPEMPQEDEDD